MNNEKIVEVCRKFLIKGEFLRVERISYGHINSTYRVYFFRDNEEKDYILQKVNTRVFKNPVQVMDNIIGITEHVRNKIKEVKNSAKRDVLHYSCTEDGKYYYTEGKDFWRCSRYIDDSVTYLTAESPFVMEEAGKAYGKFQRYLSDYPAEKLFTPIPDFHNTAKRYEALKLAVKEDKVGRANAVKDEIERYLSHEELVTSMYKAYENGEYPERVTHNDTKCSNVLFDAVTHEHLAVIDLDTVMKGLVGFDFGDAIRAGANTAEEDEPDLTKVKLSVEKYEAFTKGFMGELKGVLTDLEKETLYLGAITMTLECGARFLTDYLDGDGYFKVDYPEHNLVRARCQLKLGEDMIANSKLMADIVKKYS